MLAEPGGYGESLSKAPPPAEMGNSVDYNNDINDEDVPF